MIIWIFDTALVLGLILKKNHMVKVGCMVLNSPKGVKRPLRPNEGLVFPPNGVGRGGCVKIFPKTPSPGKRGGGGVWMGAPAAYRPFTPNARGARPLGGGFTRCGVLGWVSERGPFFRVWYVKGKPEKPTWGVSCGEAVVPRRKKILNNPAGVWAHPQIHRD